MIIVGIIEETNQRNKTEKKVNQKRLSNGNVVYLRLSLAGRGHCALQTATKQTNKRTVLQNQPVLARRIVTPEHPRPAYT